MELRQLRYFITLAEELNFTRAARRLHIVQPALSRQIMELEGELDTLLFYRSRRSVALTETGRVFLQEARKTVDQAEFAVAQAKRAHAGTVGRVEIGYSSGSVLSGVLGAILKRYRGAFPDVELRMRQVYPATQIDLLMGGDIDIIFGMSNCMALPRGCAVRPLARYPLHVVMPGDHRLAGRKAVAAKALLREPFIAHSEPEDSHGEFFLREVLGFAPRISYRSASFLFMGTLIEAGFGLSVMPSVMAAAVTGDVTSCPISGTGKSFDVAAVARKDGLNPAVTHLLAVAEAAVIQSDAGDDAGGGALQKGD